MATPTPVPAQRARLTAGVAVGLVLVAAGFVIGLRRLADNSFLTHLATGRLVLDGGVPSADPYTFTAGGEPWVVQSWLPATAYAWIEAVAGAAGVRVLIGILTASLCGLAWALTCAAPSLLGRVALVGLFLGSSAAFWSERPLMLGLCFLALVALAADGRVPAPVLLPIGWLWLNSHGSFPIGIGYLVLVAIGAKLDGSPAAVELRALRWLVGGVALGCIGPLGIGGLVFPVELLGRQEVLQHVNEWRAPDFLDLGDRLFLVFVVLSVALGFRAPRRRMLVVLVVFTALALTSTRNIPVAAIALLPAAAPALPPVGSLRSADTGIVPRALVLVAAALSVLGGTPRLAEPDYDLSRYPVTALARIEQGGLDLRRHRLAAPDVVGNLREALEGPQGDVFADDRFDMFPARVLADQLDLVRARPRARAVLDAHRIELLLWERDEPTALLFLSDPAWRPLLVDDGWVLLCRRGVDLEGSIGRC